MIFCSNGQLEHCFNNEQRNVIQQIYEAERDSRERWKVWEDGKVEMNS